MSLPTRVTMSVVSADLSTITRGVEAFARAATGLALEGLHVWLSVHPDDEDEDEDET